MKHLGSVELGTQRLVLRRITKADAHAMFENWAGQEETCRYLTWSVHESLDVTKKVIKHWLEGYKKQDFYHWGIVVKSNNTLIGTISAVEQHQLYQYAEIGYCIGPAYWGRGYTAEALRVINEFLLKQVRYGRVQAVHHINNKPSGRVMEKAGMIFEGVLRSFHYSSNNGERYDCAIYSQIETDIGE